MVQNFHRPENALKRAHELIEVGRKQVALDCLYDVIKSRKHRTWQKIHEPIITKYLELCVELRTSHLAKEGLFQYRNICQQINVKSFEDVVRGYLALAETKTEIAKAESQQSVDEIEDLEQLQTPENLLLSAVSSADAHDRADRVVLTPWIKFLWEAYRNCLDLLRNNSHMEKLYHDIAEQAFSFCIKYNRKTEFRKLCDSLRTHLGYIQKHQNHQTSVNLSNPDSLEMHLRTRFLQLESAIQVELWQDAYKAIEDIHDLMNLSKKNQNSRLMANYYQKLSLVFWKSGNFLFHAATLFRLLNLTREQKKNVTSSEMMKLASQVVLAVLTIPMPANRPAVERLIEIDNVIIDRNQRLLTTLLELPFVPSRALLIRDLLRFGIIQHAPAHLQDLYYVLETEFDPLKLCTRVQNVVNYINDREDFLDLKQYIPSIQNIAVVRLVKEISQVYRTIKFSRVLELAPFIEPFALEYLIVEIARRNDLHVRIDHRNECFHFDSGVNASQWDESIEGPCLQNLPSEQMRNQLVAMYSQIKKAAKVLQSDKREERNKLKEEIFKTYMLTSSKTHFQILSRQQIIEERKEMLENLTYQKEVEERKISEEKLQKLMEEEKKRMAKEADERTKQRILKEQSEMKRKIVMEKIEQLKKTELGCKVFEGIAEEELEKLDPDDLMSRHVEQLDRERKELQAKLRKDEKKLDHMERAKRIEEIAILEKEYEEYRVKDLEFWTALEKERISTIVEERSLAIQNRDRLLRLKDDRDAFHELVKNSHSSIYKDKMEEFKAMIESERQKRLEERRKKRKDDRRILYIKKREEDRQRAIDEKLKREREEEKAKLEEIVAKQRAKEREIEERLMREKEESASKYEKSQMSNMDQHSDRNTTWRDREQEKKLSWGPKEEKSRSDVQGWRRKEDDSERKNDKEQGDDKSYSRPSEDKSYNRPSEDKNYSRPGEDKSFSRPGEDKSFSRPTEGDWRNNRDSQARSGEDSFRSSWRSGPASRDRDARQESRYGDRFSSFQFDKSGDDRDSSRKSDRFSRREDDDERAGDRQDRSFGSRNERPGMRSGDLRKGDSSSGLWRRPDSSAPDSGRSWRN